MHAPPWPPPLPDSSAFVAPPVPRGWQTVAMLLRAVGPSVPNRWRIWRRGGRIFAYSLLHGPLHLFWRACGWPSPWPRRFMAAAARACGIRVRAIGQPVAEDVVFVANHLSWTDALILGGLTGTAFVAQDGIAGWPGIGLLCRLNDTIFVSRADRMGVAGQIAALSAQFARRPMLAIFPEATCSDGRRLLPFKASLFAMLAAPGSRAVIQPVVIDVDEAGRDLAWVGLETGAANALRLLGRAGAWEARVHFLEPFPAADTPDRKAMAARARAAIAAKLSETLGGRPVA